MENQTEKYEKGHIKRLQEERVRIQKKTFTKWMNSHLSKVNMKVNDLFTDLADGKHLIKLMEIISGEHLGKPNLGRLRVQKIENVNRALHFIQSKVILENIGAEDIVDGNQRLILGLIWTIILRFEIQNIQYDQEKESGEKRSAKDALLLWCQRRTKNYRGVNVKDFSSSWRDGLAFNALIHAHRPDIIDFDRLNPQERQKNLHNAFNVAYEHLGVPNLLDPEDVDVEKPDDKIIMTYVSSLYHTFAKMKTETTGAKRVANLVSSAMDYDKMVSDYELNVRQLLEWIRRKTEELKDRHFPNSLELMQKEMTTFKQYRTVEKPVKFKERSDTDALLFQLYIKQKQHGFRKYTPPEGLLLKDIETAWNGLEKAEHSRELDIRSELLRLERLQREADKFMTKAKLRKSWLTDMTKILANNSLSTESSQLDTALKRHQSVSAEILARKQRFKDLNTMAESLVEQKYENADKISEFNRRIQQQWKDLQQLLAQRQENNALAAELLEVLRALETIEQELQALHPIIHSNEFGNHLPGAEELLERHSLCERQLKTLQDRYKQIQRRSKALTEKLNYRDGEDSTEVMILTKRLVHVGQMLDQLMQHADGRRRQLVENCLYLRLLQDMQEEDVWLQEKQKLMDSKDMGQDMSSLLRLLRRHKLQEQEIQAHSTVFDGLSDKVRELQNADHFATPQLQKRLNELKEAWNRLREASARRKALLRDAEESQQYYADAREAEQWMLDRQSLVCAKDYGKDEGQSRALWKRQRTLHMEIENFGKSDLKHLKEQSLLMTQSADKHQLNTEKLQREHRRRQQESKVPDDLQSGRKRATSAGSDYDSQTSDGSRSEVSTDDERVTDDTDGNGNFREVAVEEEVEEMVTKSVVREEPETVELHQGRLLHAYTARDTSGRDISGEKDDIVVIVNKVSAEWWLVENSRSKQRGYMPANHIRDMGVQSVQRMVRRTVQEQVPTMVKRTVMRRVPISQVTGAPAVGTAEKKPTGASGKKPPRKIGAIRRIPSARKADNLHFDKEAIEKRQKELEYLYQSLLAFGQERERHLADSERLFRFEKECKQFESWMIEKEREFAVKDTLSTDVEAAKKRYADLINELALNAGRLRVIHDLRDALLASETHLDPSLQSYLAEVGKKLPSPVDKNSIKKRAKDIDDRWDKLNTLKTAKERALKDVSGIERFNKVSGELKEWIVDKLDELEKLKNDVGRDKKTNEALLRRHQNLENEISHMKEKLDTVRYLGNGVKNTYPDESSYVDGKVKEVENLWNKLLGAADDRKARLSSAGQRQSLQNQAVELALELGSLLDAASRTDLPRDVPGAKEALNQHADLKDNIDTAETKLDSLKSLAAALKKICPSDTTGAKLISDLEQQLNAVHAAWEKRQKQLKDAERAQKFLQECDQIDLITAQQARVLDFKEVPVSVADVQRAQKQHENFLAMLDRQESRVGKLKDMLKKLDSEVENNDLKTKPHQRVDEVVEHRNAVKQKAAKRSQELNSSLKFLEFKEAANELEEWLKEKQLAVNQQDHKDLAHIGDKLKKHEALVTEVKAHENELAHVEKLGKDLLAIRNLQLSPAQREEVTQQMKNLRQLWDALLVEGAAKSERLKQAEKQRALNADAGLCGDGIDQLLRALAAQEAEQPFPGDLLQAKDALRRHGKLMDALNAEKARLAQLKERGDEMIKAGHFDKSGLSAALQSLIDKAASVDPVLAARLQKLQRALQYHQFLFDVSEQMERIRSLRALASSEDYGHTLAEVTSLLNRHKNLSVQVNNMEPQIKALLQTKAPELRQLIRKTLSQEKPKKGPTAEDLEKDLDSKCNLLDRNWQELQQLMNRRAHQLRDHEAAYQLFADMIDLKEWLQEKSQWLERILAHPPRDKDAVDKLHHKVKSLETDMKHPSDQIDLIEKKRIGELRQAAEKDQTLSEDMLDNVQQKVGELRARQESLEQAAKLGHHVLHQYVKGFEYMHDAEDLEVWITEMLQKASSTECGDDADHLSSIVNRWSDLKATVEAGEARYKACDENASELLTPKSQKSTKSGKPRDPNMPQQHPMHDTIASQQQRLRDDWRLLQQQIAVRERDLGTAREVHMFNRDMADCRGRISEKLASLISKRQALQGDEGGMNRATLKAHSHGHELFQKELAILEQQVLDLQTTGSHLARAYPGSNAAAVENQLNALQKLWTDLQAKSDEWYKYLMDTSLYLTFQEETRRQKEWLWDASNEADGIRNVLQSGQAASSPSLSNSAAHLHECESRLGTLLQELNARDKDFSVLVNKGESMVENEHYAQREIQDVIDQLLDNKNQLHQRLSQTSDAVKEAICVQRWLKEYQPVNSQIVQKQAQLQTASLGSDLQEVDAALRKHSERESNIKDLQPKLEALAKEGELVKQKAPSGVPTVNERMKAIQTRMQQLQRSQAEHGNLLIANQVYLTFLAKAADFSMWLQEKEGQLISLSGEANTLEQKIRLLQKYQAFEAEVLANEEQLVTLESLADQLISKYRHPQTEAIGHQTATLQAQWKRLKLEMAQRGVLFEGAKDLLAFHSEVDLIESWIRAKGILLASHDLGKDLEHCQSIRQNLHAPEEGKTVNDVRIAQLGQLLSRLPKSDPKSANAAKASHDEVVKRYKATCAALKAYDGELESAEKIHAFHREIQDLSVWMEEKLRLASSSERGQDVPSVNNLLRSQDRLERDLMAIKIKLQDLHKKKQTLVSTPEEERLFTSLGSGDLSGVDALLEKVESQVKLRRYGLQRSLAFYTYTQDCQQLLTWCDRREDEMRTTEKLVHQLEQEIVKEASELTPLTTISEVRARLQEHIESTAYDVNTWATNEKQRLLTASNQWLNTLATQTVPKEAWMTGAAEKVQTLAHTVPPRVETLQTLWSKIDKRINHLVDVKTFLVLCQQQKEWTSDRETEFTRSMETLVSSQLKAEKRQKRHQRQLENDNRQTKNAAQKDGHSGSESSSASSSDSDNEITESYLGQEAQPGWNLTQVESVLRKLEGSLLPSLKSRQAHAVDGELTAALTALQKNENPSAAHAKTAWQKVSDSMMEACATFERQRQLLREEVEILRTRRTLLMHIAWCKQRIRLATEANWIDGLHLESKLVKWESHNQETLSHLDAMTIIFEECTKLPEGLNAGRTRTSLAPHLKELKETMETLRCLSALKLRRLKEAKQWNLWYYQYVQLFRWTEKAMDPVIESEAHAQLSEVNAVKVAIKKHEALQGDLESKTEQFHDWSAEGERMCQSDHYQKDEVLTLMNSLKARFDNYLPEMKKKAAQLKATLQVCQFYQDCREETLWIEERMKLASNKELPASLYDLVRLQKRHQQLMSELASHETLFSELKTQHQHLMEESTHLLEEQKHRVQHEWDMLMANHKALKRAAKDREERLAQAIRLQSLLEELSEVETWIKERTVSIRNSSAKRLQSVASKITDKNGVLSLEDTAQSDMKRLDTIEMDLRNVATKQLDSIQESVDNLTNGRDRAEATDKLKSVNQRSTEFSETLKQERENLLFDLKYFSYAHEALEWLEWMHHENERLEVEEYGQDLEHCQLLNAEFEETAKTISNQGNKVNACIAKGNKLVEASSVWTEGIRDTNQKLNSAWAQLRNSTKTCKEALSGALLVHKFSADSEDLVALIQDKWNEIPDLDSSQVDLARRRAENLSVGGFTTLDLLLQASTQAGFADKNKSETLRECNARHEALLREMVVLEKQKDKLEKEAERLSSLYPNAKDHIDGKLHEVLIGWHSLHEKMRSRRDALKQSMRIQNWLDECREWLNWMKRQQALITEVKKLPTDVEGAENLLQKSVQHGQDIKSHASTHDRLLKSGRVLKNELPEFQGLLDEKMDSMERSWTGLNKLWEKCKEVYEENVDLRRFFHETRNLQQWLLEQEQQLGASTPVKDLTTMASLETAEVEHLSLLQKVNSAKARFDALKRLTRLEARYQALRGGEKDEEGLLPSQKEFNDIRRTATKRIIEERKRQAGGLGPSQTVLGGVGGTGLPRSGSDVGTANIVVNLSHSRSKPEFQAGGLTPESESSGALFPPTTKAPKLGAKFSIRRQPPTVTVTETLSSGDQPPATVSQSAMTSGSSEMPPLPGRAPASKAVISSGVALPRFNLDNILDEESSVSSSESEGEPRSPSGVQISVTSVDSAKTPGKQVQPSSSAESPTAKKSSTLTGVVTQHKTITREEHSLPTSKAQTLQTAPKATPESSTVTIRQSSVSSTQGGGHVSANLKHGGDGPPLPSKATSKEGSRSVQQPLSPASPTSPVMHLPSVPSRQMASDNSARASVTLRLGTEAPSFEASGSGSASASFQQRPQSSTLPPNYQQDKKHKKEGHGIGRLVPGFMKSKSKTKEDPQ